MSEAKGQVLLFLLVFVWMMLLAIMGENTDSGSNSGKIDVSALSSSRGLIHFISHDNQLERDDKKKPSEYHGPENGLLRPKHFAEIFPSSVRNFPYTHHKVSKVLSYLFTLLALICTVFACGVMGAGFRFGRGLYFVVAFVLFGVAWYLVRFSFWLDHS